MAKITPIPNYPAYSVSTDGIVFKGNKELKTYTDKRGYHAVYLYDGHNNRKYMAVHRLVMMAHQPIENPSEMTVNHKDNDKNNNTIENLEWLTNADNLRHSFANGYRKNLGGKKGRTYSINPEMLAQMFVIYKTTKTSIKKIAEEYGVNRSTLQYQIKHNLTGDK